MDLLLLILLIVCLMILWVDPWSAEPWFWCDGFLVVWCFGLLGVCVCFANHPNVPYSDYGMCMFTMNWVCWQSMCVLFFCDTCSWLEFGVTFQPSTPVLEMISHFLATMFWWGFDCVCEWVLVLAKWFSLLWIGLNPLYMLGFPVGHLIYDR
jgi:hypothetical protein